MLRVGEKSVWWVLSWTEGGKGGEWEERANWHPSYQTPLGCAGRRQTGRQMWWCALITQLSFCHWPVLVWPFPLQGCEPGDLPKSARTQRSRASGRSERGRGATMQCLTKAWETEGGEESGRVQPREHGGWLLRYFMKLKRIITDGFSHKINGF